MSEREARRAGDCVKLQDAGHRERQFALKLWNEAKLDNRRPFWPTLEKAQYDAHHDEVFERDETGAERAFKVES